MASWHKSPKIKQVFFQHDSLNENHTREDGGAHLTISFRHLLANIENPPKNRLLKK